jgi:hypothetical protein
MPTPMSTEFDDLLGGAPAPSPAYTTIGNPESVPTVFADTAIFAYRFGGTVRVQFVEAINGAADSTSPGIKTRYVGNLVMPVEGFANMLEYLNGIAESMKLPGANPAPEPENGAA